MKDIVEAPDFYTLTVSQLTPEQAEIVSAWAFDHGALGVEEILEFEQSGREYEPVTIQRELTSIKIYFQTSPHQNALDELKKDIPQAVFELHGEKNQDWLEVWRKDYKPFLLCGPIWVVPSWSEVPEEALKVIRIDPEMAFGTGTHETTQLAAHFIFEFNKFKLREDIERESLLDVGTGTGILAMLAELMGFGAVVGNDIDPESRRVARENLEKNKMKRTQIVDLSLSQIQTQYDWVVANIIDGVLVQLQPDLKRCLKPNGHLLLTGILNEREELFRSEFSFDGFQLKARHTRGEWVGYLLQKKS